MSADVASSARDQDSHIAPNQASYCENTANRTAGSVQGRSILARHRRVPEVMRSEDGAIITCMDQDGRHFFLQDAGWVDQPDLDAGSVVFSEA